MDTGLIEWYVDGVKQNTTGPAFTFTPPAGLGSYAIYAKVKNTDIKSEERTVSVTGEGFSAITSLTINRPSNLSQTLDGSQTPIVFTVKPNPDTNVDLSLIEWYVNGTPKQPLPEARNLRIRQAQQAHLKSMRKYPDSA